MLHLKSTEVYGIKPCEVRVLTVFRLGPTPFLIEATYSSNNCLNTL